MTTAFSDEQYDEAYPDGIDGHWWCWARANVFASALASAGLKKSRILEVGAGRGVVIKTLREYGFDCEGVELANVTPVPQVADHFTSGKAAADMDATQRDGYEVLMLLDVIEHIENPLAFLEELVQAFPNVKKILIAVPAGQQLWSNHDEFYGHYRRYSTAMLADLATGLGASLEANRYFFRILYPLLWLPIKLGFSRNTNLATPKKSTAWLHKLAGRVAQLDYNLLPQSVPGSSALAIFTFDR